MTPQPGYRQNLTQLTDDALAANNPNQHIDWNLYHETSQISLIVAVLINGRIDLAERLLKAGATMTADDLSHVLSWHGDAGMVALLLNYGVPFNERCFRMAIRHELWNTVYVFLSAGRDVHTPIRSFDTLTLLHAAAWAGSLTEVKEFIRRGIPLDELDSAQCTPLMKAATIPKYYWQSCIDVVAYLLEQGADPNLKDEMGDTALLLCLNSRFNHRYDSPAHSNGKDRETIMQLLLQYGANPNAVSRKGMTALMQAARINCETATIALLRAGADPNQRLPNGMRAFDIAVREGSTEVATLLKA